MEIVLISANKKAWMISSVVNDWLFFVINGLCTRKKNDLITVLLMYQYLHETDGNYSDLLAIGHNKHSSAT